MNAAVITETRPKAIIPEIIEQHLSMLPDNYELIVFCSKESERNFTDYSGKFNKYIVKVNTLHDYNMLMTSQWYWSKLLAYEHVLIFQTDSKILRPGIEVFYEWDYIGSPWKFQDHGGNGGLSLRTPKVIMQIIKNIHYSGIPYEDVFLSNHLEKYGKLAPRSECKKFSCETIFELGTFAYHAIQNYMSHGQIEQIENQY
ncbi:MAG: hypothetical protein IIC75_06335 [Bacteroidetes bacterium]|nr:hypothetical protein [Bacteroidota bacterium]